MSVRPLVAGNWKMNTDREDARRLAGDILAGIEDDLRVDLLVAPPFPFLCDIVELLDESPVRVAAQNVATDDAGAHTGEVSATMLASTGCTDCIVGHSERRAMYGDTDDSIARKINRLLEAGLRPIICIGETLEERESGDTLTVIVRQLSSALDALGAESRFVLAYEPVWAIGTGLTATPDQIVPVHEMIRGTIVDRFGSHGEMVPILYGGSVKPENAAELFGQPNVDGGLVGGASLEASSFLAIVEGATDRTEGGHQPG